MNISASDAILLAHAAFGVCGSLAALWVFVDTLSARSANLGRIRKAARLTAVCIIAAGVCGGYWYLHFYPADRVRILAGPWAFAHNTVMETKEHLFFVTMLLACLLVIAAREQLATNAAARKLVLVVAALTALTGLALEGGGALIDHGVKVALLSHER